MKVFILLLVVLNSFLSFSQNTFSIIPEFGVQLNSYKAAKPFDEKHFSDKKPISSYLGVKFQYEFKPSHLLITKVKYINSKVKFQYKVNEPDIPYEENSSFSIIYKGLQAGIGYQKQFIKRDIPFFLQLDVNFEHQVNSVSRISNSSEGNTIELDDTLSFSTTIISNLGAVSNFVSASLSFGAYMGKTKNHQFTFFVDYPFGKIQRSNPTYESTFEYQGVTYNHRIETNGSIVRYGISYGYVISL